MNKKIQLINDDYLGHFDICRHACRGIVIKDGKILLSYESNEDKYIIPGGGVEGDESFAECCVREILEETGIRVKPIENYLEIEELLNGLNDENEQLNENNMHLHYELRLKNDKVLGLEKENKELSEQVEYLKKQVKIFRGECNRLTKENTELLEELYD